MGVVDTLFMLFDERSWIETSVVAVGSSLTAAFYILHKKYSEKARKVEDAPVFEINENLTNIVRESPYGSIPYAIISGEVNTFDPPLVCRNDQDIKGVLWKHETTEHKDVWSKYANQWNSQQRKISSITNSVPIVLCDQFGLSAVKLDDPAHSAWFDDTVKVIHEHFTPSNESAMHSFMNFVSGERLKGFTESESMLRLKSKLCAIGELVYDDNELKLQAPSKQCGDYIVTDKLRTDVINHFRKSSFAWKITALIMAGATMAALYFLGKRLIRRFYELQQKKKLQQEMDIIRHQRTVSSAHANRGTINESELCVVCLQNPRECVLLDCGHVCLCVDCLESLPAPLECPVCRSPVIRTVPLFMA